MLLNRIFERVCHAVASAFSSTQFVLYIICIALGALLCQKIKTEPLDTTGI